ncbi:MAG TPA: gas vesicle protein GvpJ [Marmoricola sp.]|nr:gas vesicle protein GvpJ [Marmoricola sp.]
MTVQTQRRGGGGYLERPAPSGLADVIEIILDKGLVIDAYVRVSLVGIEILTIDARIVIASVDTYLRFAEATNRLDLYEKGGKDLTEAIGDLQEGGASKKTSGALKGAKKAVKGAVSGDDDDKGSSRSRSRKRQSADA